MTEPKWLAIARGYLGVREIGTTNESPTIRQWLKNLGWSWLKRAPWCGVFVAQVLKEAGHAPAKSGYRAKDWLTWGKPCLPALGAIGVLDRQGGGHVFFVTRVSRSFVWGIGGNQSNMVNEAKFDRKRLLGCRWPASEPAPVVLANSADAGGALSTNEA